MRSPRAGLVRLFDLWVGLPVAARAIAPVAVMVVLWYSSAREPKPAPPSVLRALLHNGAHVVAYGGLGAAWLLALLPSRGLASDSDAAGSAVVGAVPRNVAGAAVALAVLYGGVDELHQMYVPGRTSSLWDVASDASGALLAVTFVLWVLRGDARLARRLLAVTAVAALCVCAATFLPG